NADDAKAAVLAEAGILLRVAPGLESASILQDLVKFELIVGNLIQNGLHYRRGRLEVELREQGDQIEVVVRDDGPGIAQEHQSAVFERYKQVPANDGIERKGHGLGLAGSLILARRLGG